jgi:hypothetical protein
LCLGFWIVPDNGLVVGSVLQYLCRAVAIGLIHAATDVAADQYPEQGPGDGGGGLAIAFSDLGTGDTANHTT